MTYSEEYSESKNIPSLYPKGPFLIFTEGEFSHVVPTWEEATAFQMDAEVSTSGGVTVNVVSVAAAIAAPLLIAAYDRRAGDKMEDLDLPADQWADGYKCCHRSWLAAFKAAITQAKGGE